MHLLVGDIGGTNARLVLYEAPDEISGLRGNKEVVKHKAVSQHFYKNNDFESFTEVLLSFLSLPHNANIKIHSCCFAVAGPVANNEINFTNREGWIIDGFAIKEEFNIDSVVLINDFVANGYGILSLSDAELHTLQEGKGGGHKQVGTRPAALLGAGTGLGECYLTPNSDGSITAFPTEGGHVEFAPRSLLESELLHYLQTRLGDKGETVAHKEADVLPRVSVERLVSGKGLENIYEFLRQKYPEQVNEVLDGEYNESSERGRLIGGEKYNYNLFKLALEMMFSIYGGEAGNVALKYLPHGGVYIAGGIAPKNIEFITNKDSQFMARFLDKGRMATIMPDFPVYVVMKEDLGLRGAHTIASKEAAKLLERQGKGELVLEASPTEEVSVGEALRQAVRAYPGTYAAVTSATAVFTAAACVCALQVLKRMDKI